jgi:hypothetical protein
MMTCKLVVLETSAWIGGDDPSDSSSIVSGGMVDRNNESENQGVLAQIVAYEANNLIMLE